MSLFEKEKKKIIIFFFTLNARWPLHVTVKLTWKNGRNAQQSPMVAVI